MLGSSGSFAFADQSRFLTALNAEANGFERLGGGRHIIGHALP